MGILETCWGDFAGALVEYSSVSSLSATEVDNIKVRQLQVSKSLTTFQEGVGKAKGVGDHGPTPEPSNPKPMLGYLPETEPDLALRLAVRLSSSGCRLSVDNGVDNPWFMGSCKCVAVGHCRMSVFDRYMVITEHP